MPAIEATPDHYTALAGGALPQRMGKAAGLALKSGEDAVPALALERVQSGLEMMKIVGHAPDLL